MKNSKYAGDGIVGGHFYAVLVWLVVALFYGIEYFQRVAPGVIAQPLQHSLQVSPATLGLILALYYYAYAMAQIPVGIILDRFGARWPLALASLAVTIGTLLFATVNDLSLLALARILVGIGSAFAFVGCLKIAQIWFSKHWFPFVVGLTNTLGVLGALFGEAPLSHLIHYMGWQHALMLTAGVSFFISLLIMLVVRNQPTVTPKVRHAIAAINTTPIKTTLSSILRDTQTWVTAIYASIMVAPVIAFAELWAVPFLQKTHRLNPEMAAFSVSLIFVGIAIGGPIHGLFAGLLKRRKHILFFGQMGALITLSLIVFVHSFNLLALQGLLWLFGFSTSSMLLCFPMNTERHPSQYSASVIAFTNMLIMLMGAMFQPFIGFILEMVGASKAIAMYSANDFTKAMLVLPAILLINFLLLLVLKEPTRRQVPSV